MVVFSSPFCVTIEFLPIFGETIFVEVPKFTKSTKFVAIEKVPYGDYNNSMIIGATINKLTDD